MNIPQQFEFVKTYYQFTTQPKAPVFVTILNAFSHHYTGTKMYHIRIEHDGTFGFNSNPSPFVDYKTVTEDELVEMLATRAEEAEHEEV